MTEGAISPIPREARAFQGSRAGIVTRAAAATLDGLVVGFIVVSIYLGYAAARFLIDPLRFTFPEASLLVSLGAALGLAVIYLALAWGITGRTYGCHVMGLRVVNVWGRRMRPGGALIRAVFCVLFPIGLLWCAVSRQNRSVQDVVLRTSVIYDWKPRPGWHEQLDITREG